MTFTHPNPPPSVEPWKMALGFMLGLFGSLVVSKEFLGVMPGSMPVILCGLAGAALGFIIPTPWQSPWTVLHVGSDDSIALFRGRNESCTVPCRHVTLIAGEGGISLDGGEMLIWKRIRIATEREGYSVELGSKNNSSCYQHLLKACPDAVGVSYTGEMCLPTRPDFSRTLEWRSSVLTVARREFGRQTIRSAVAATLMMVVALFFVGVVGLAALQQKIDDAGQLIVGRLSSA